MTDAEIYKRQSPEPPWTWRIFDEEGIVTDSVPAVVTNGVRRGGGFNTLPECVEAVLEKYPDAIIRGIGADEPEAEGLEFPGKVELP